VLSSKGSWAIVQMKGVTLATFQPPNYSTTYMLFFSSSNFFEQMRKSRLE
jgi:hypothetical protein